jgi:hypothetical protein
MAPNSRGLRFLRLAKRRRLLIGHTKLRVRKINKIHKVHASKIQGRVFSEVAAAPKAAPRIRSLLGYPKAGKQIIWIDKNNEEQKKQHNTKGTCSKIVGAYFSDVDEAPMYKINKEQH